jgi:hypothetical protein
MATRDSSKSYGGGRKRKNATVVVTVDTTPKSPVESSSTTVDVKKEEEEEMSVSIGGEESGVVATTPPAAKKAKRSLAVPSIVIPTINNPRSLARHVNFFASKHAESLVKKQEEYRNCPPISIHELDEFIRSESSEVKMAFLLPAMHWMRKTVLTIEAVAMMDKPKAMIPEVLEFTNQALSSDHGEDVQTVHALRQKFGTAWWKIPSKDYELVRDLLTDGAKVKAVLVSLHVQSFPDERTNEIVECIMPGFRYYSDFSGVEKQSQAQKKAATPRKQRVLKAKPSAASETQSPSSPEASPPSSEAEGTVNNNGETLQEAQQ